MRRGASLDEASPDEGPPRVRPGRNNHGLAWLVLQMVRDGRMQKEVMMRCGRPEWYSEPLTNLVAMFEAPDSPQHDHHYGPATCVEFQRLLVATLLSYGQALCKFGRNETPEARKRNCESVWICGLLLREIASSLMLRQHLKACRVWLSAPSHGGSNMRHYQVYTGFDTAKYPSPDATDPGYEDDDDDEICQDARAGLDQVFLKWIRLQASHFLALGTISRAFGSPLSLSGVSKVPTVSLLAVPPPLPLEVDWKSTVTRLFGSEAGLEAIKVIKRCVIDGKNVPAAWKPARHDHTIRPQVTRHCEALLAALGKYAHGGLIQLGEDDELIQLLQVIFYLCNHDTH